MLERFKRWREERGRFPDELRSELEREGIEVIEERVPLEAIFRGYTVAGQRPRSGHQSERGSIALTSRRLVVHGTGRLALQVPRGATWFEASNPEPDRLKLAYEASNEQPTRAGDVELELQTPRAAEIHASLQAWMATPSS
jgi:hypothetical protein